MAARTTEQQPEAPPSPEPGEAEQAKPNIPRTITRLGGIVVTENDGVTAIWHRSRLWHAVIPADTPPDAYPPLRYVSIREAKRW